MSYWFAICFMYAVMTAITFYIGYKTDGYGRPIHNSLGRYRKSSILRLVFISFFWWGTLITEIYIMIVDGLGEKEW